MKSTITRRAWLDSTRRYVPLLLLSALVAGLVALTPASPVRAQSAPATGVYMPLTPARVYNSSQPGGGWILAAGGTRDVQLTGVGGVPSTDVLAVVVDLTVWETPADGWGLLWPAGTPRPNPASSINYIPGTGLNSRTVTNTVTTKVSATGAASFYTWSPTQFLIDVIGYYRTSPGGGGYVPVTQTRVMNTPATGVKVAGASGLDRKLRGVGGIPDSPAVTAVALNASVINNQGSGYLTFWPKGAPWPGTASLNYTQSHTRTQLVIAALSGDGFTSIYNGGAATDIVLDVVGYYTAGSGAAYVPLTSSRIVDSRVTPIVNSQSSTPSSSLPPNSWTTVQVAGAGGVPATGVSTVVLSVVADAGTSADGYLILWPNGEVFPPDVVQMSYYRNEDTSNLAMVKLGTDSKIAVYNYLATTAIVLDVVGYFSTDPGPSAPTNVIAAPANQAAALAWGPPVSDGGTAIAGYLVKVYKTTPTLTYVSETTTCATCTSTTLTGLTNGQPYQFEVFARNSLGYGSSATSNSVTAGGSSDLLKPTITQVTTGNGQATVASTRPSVRLEGLTSYVVNVFAEVVLPR